MGYNLVHMGKQSKLQHALEPQALAAVLSFCNQCTGGGIEEGYDVQYISKL
jgi:hypothetical protein